MPRRMFQLFLFSCLNAQFTRGRYKYSILTCKDIGNIDITFDQDIHEFADFHNNAERNVSIVFIFLFECSIYKWEIQVLVIGIGHRKHRYNILIKTFMKLQIVQKPLNERFPPAQTCSFFTFYIFLTYPIILFKWYPLGSAK